MTNRLNIKVFLLLGIILLFLNGKCQDYKFVSSGQGEVQEIYLNGAPNQYFNNLHLLSSLSTTNQDKLSHVFFISICKNKKSSGKKEEKVLKNFIKTFYNSTAIHLELYKEFIDTNSQNNIKSNDTFKAKLPLTTSNKKEKKLNINYVGALALTDTLFKLEVNKYSLNTSTIPCTTGSIKGWVQDHFTISKDGRFLFYNKNNDYSDSFTLLNQNYDLDSIAFSIEGGNMLFYDSIVFIGLDYKTYEDSLVKYFGENIIWVGHELVTHKNINGYKKNDKLVNDKSIQPWFHIDLFLNVLEINDKLTLCIAKAAGKNKAAVDEFNSNMKISFDSVVEQLNNKNIPHNIDTIMVLLKRVNTTQKYYYLFSNMNGLFETKQNTCYAYLPKFINKRSSTELKKVQDSCDTAYRQMGVVPKFIDGIGFPNHTNYKTNPFPGYFKKAKNHGALHCQVKVLKRAPIQ